MSITVTLQLNVGVNEAGDWANRSTEAGIATSERADIEHSSMSGPTDELMIRLHDLRGAIEAMKHDPHSASLAETRSSHADLTYGEPTQYTGLHFTLPALD